MADRTQAEILERFTQAEQADMFGWRAEVLVQGMTVETLVAAGFDEPARGVWHARSAAELEADARQYLEFAIGKIEDHRGLSAERSVMKLREHAWLMGRDDAIKAMDAAAYAQYGAPQVKAFATLLGWDWPDDAELNRMADGDPCTPGCGSGCGQ